MKPIVRNIISISVLSVAVFFLGFATARLMPGQNTPQKAVVAPVPSPVTDQAAKKISLMIDFGDGKIWTSSEEVWHDGESVYDALKQFSDRLTLDLKVKDYGGDLGVFVEAINGKQDPKNKAWWQYWVNNEYGKIGASSAKLKPGDVVMWKLTVGQEQ